jgi:hypothetical protein
MWKLLNLALAIVAAVVMFMAGALAPNLDQAMAIAFSRQQRIVAVEYQPAIAFSRQQRRVLIAATQVDCQNAKCVRATGLGPITATA